MILAQNPKRVIENEMISKSFNRCLGIFDFSKIVVSFVFISDSLGYDPRIEVVVFSKNENKKYLTSATVTGKRINIQKKCISSVIFAADEIMKNQRSS